MQTNDLVTFLSRIPSTIDLEEWKSALQSNLIHLFSDVDHVIVALNAALDLTPVEEGAFGHKQVVYSHIPKQTARQSYALRSMQRRAKEERWQQIYEQGVRMGMPHQQWQYPSGIDLVRDDGEYCGSLLFLRRKGLDPISDATTKAIAAMRPFLTFLFTDHVARVRAVRPSDNAFVDALQRIAREVELTRREEQTLLMLLSGKSYETAAAALSIGVESYAVYVKRLYTKLNVKSVKEVFARYIWVERHASVDV